MRAPVFSVRRPQNGNVDRFLLDLIGNDQHAKEGARRTRTNIHLFAVPALPNRRARRSQVEFHRHSASPRVRAARLPAGRYLLPLSFEVFTLSLEGQPARILDCAADSNTGPVATDRETSIWRQGRFLAKNRAKKAVDHPRDQRYHNEGGSLSRLN